MKEKLLLLICYCFAVSSMAASIDISQLKKISQEKVISSEQEEIISEILNAIVKSKDSIDAAELSNLLKVYLELDSTRSDHPEVIFKAQQDMIYFVVPKLKNKSYQSIRQEVKSQLVSFLGYLKSHWIKDYVSLPTTLTVPLPQGVSGAYGMDPSEIENTKHRAKYEAAIAQNLKNIHSNSLQSSLRQIIPVVEEALQSISGQ